MSRILVFGGSGFIGRSICRVGVAAGHEMVSVSRSGQPSDDAASPLMSGSRRTCHDDGWVDEVEWVAADLFEPVTWRDQLADCNAVIHSVGITIESTSDGVIFQRFNGDGPILTALEAERAGASGYVFLSATRPPPWVSSAYTAAKRRAERNILDLDLRTAVLRPGPVYDSTDSNPHLSWLANRIARALGEREWFEGVLGEIEPLPVGTVGRAALRAGIDPTIGGLFDIPAIRKMASGAERHSFSTIVR